MLKIRCYLVEATIFLIVTGKQDALRLVFSAHDQSDAVSIARSNNATSRGRRKATVNLIKLKGISLVFGYGINTVLLD